MMYSRWFSMAVILLWLSTMGWLIKEKVLPTFLLGDPPSCQSVLEAQDAELETSWRLLWNHHKVGWARSKIIPQHNGGVRIDNVVHFDDLPVDRLAPGWLRGIFNMIKRSDGSDAHAHHTHDWKISADAANAICFGANKRLLKIESTISFLPSGKKISLQGIVDDGCMNIVVSSLDISFRTKISIDDKLLLVDVLSPIGRLPNLYEGQTWTISSLNPMKYPGQTYDILSAKVEGTQRIIWDGHATETWHVVYRDSTDANVDSSARPRGRLWVRRDGVVLKQEMSILNSSVTFVRMPTHD